MVAVEHSSMFLCFYVRRYWRELWGVCVCAGGIIKNHECVTLHSIASYVLYIYH